MGSNSETTSHLAVSPESARTLTELAGEAGAQPEEFLRASAEEWLSHPRKAQGDQESEQTSREQWKVLHSFMELSLERLRPRDYAILYDYYELGAVGMAEPIESSPLTDLKPGARRVALWRARERFLGELDQILRDADQSLKGEAAPDFAEAASYVLKKNADLYRRLA
jgi:hypothetical protein